MRKRLLKLVSLTLALVLSIVMIAPGSAQAQESSADQIRQQIRRTYSKALSLFGRSSFDGYCGTLTGYQLYILGITAQPDLKNGKDGYDTYCNQKTSTGGYGIRAYPARSWTLREALDDITDNGTRDAYNILVGFQATPSVRGGKYGHSCVIHAIIDGQVYFVESYDVKLNGTRYSEGSPIVCSIEDFCAYYKMTTTKFDGVIHFGAKDYVDLCNRYPSSFYAAALEAAEVRSQPCTAEADDSSELITVLTPGQQLQVVSTVENTQGEYWYQLEGTVSGYIRAEQAKVRQFLFDDVTVEKVKAPTVLCSGKSYQIKGELLSTENTLYTVRSQVYRMEGSSMEQVCAASDIVDGKSYNLKGSLIAEELKLDELEPGSYRYELAAVVGNYYYEKGQLQTQWETVSVWNSDFRVTQEKCESVVVTFEGTDGRVSVDSRALVAGEAIGQLPDIQRSGYVFLGWFTRPEGGQRITEDFVPTENMIVYAQWSSPELLQDAWSNAGECWYYYADGISTMGCIELDGTMYYFTAPDAAGHGGLVWTTAH